MKPRAALVLSITGILITGSAALAVNTATLNSPHTSTIGNAGNLLLPNAQPTRTATPANTVASPKATPQATNSASSGKKANDGKASTPQKPSPSPLPGSSQGRPVTTQPVPGSDGAIATQPGDDKGGLRSGGSGGHGSDD